MRKTAAALIGLALLAADPAAAGRNPFSFGAEPDRERRFETGVRVTFVVVAGRYRRAVVDGRIVAVGDPVDGGRVVAIDAGGIVVERDGVSLRHRVESR